METSLTIRNLDGARALIEKANTSQLKEIINRAEALRTYAAQAKKGLEIQNQCAEIKLRAERRIGEQLKAMPKKHGARPADLQDVSPSLKELGIEHIQSHRWQAVASLPEKDFEKHMAEVKQSNEELTTIGVIRLARELGKKKPQNVSPLPKGVFNVIYADPPFRYDFSETTSRAIESHYPSLDLEKIQNIKIPTAKDSVLFLWAMAPKLEEALSVLSAWGFVYKTCAVWDKEIIGMGYWFRQQHEVLLVGAKGNPQVPEDKKRVSSVIRFRRMKHSQKPEVVYEIIESYFPNGKYLELFHRGVCRPGWVCFGNENLQ